MNFRVSAKTGMPVQCLLSFRLLPLSAAGTCLRRLAPFLRCFESQGRFAVEVAQNVVERLSTGNRELTQTHFVSKFR